ncbi:MAG: ferrous iron transport protein A [Caldilineaceae bacterium]|nr:ferrous iron transport protein A [Caldilineaceae bacterium]
MIFAELLTRRRGKSTPCPWAPDGVCTLDCLQVGCTVCLQRMTCKPGQARRLADMGIVPGVELTVLQRGGGPMLIAVGDTRVALGKSVARALQVTAAGAQDNTADTAAHPGQA